MTTTFIFATVAFLLLNRGRGGEAEREEDQCKEGGKVNGQCSCQLLTILRHYISSSSNRKSIVSSLPRLTSPHLPSPPLTSPHLPSPPLTSSPLTSPPLTSPLLSSPHLTSPHLTSPHLPSPHLTSPHLISLHFT